MEHVAGGQSGLSVLVHLPEVALEIAVAADDFFLFRIPHDELLVAVVTNVEFIDVELLARTTARLAESNLAQSTYLTQHVGSIVGRDNINLVVALVCHAQLQFGPELALEQCFVYRWNDGLFHILF